MELDSLEGLVLDDEEAPLEKRKCMMMTTSTVSCIMHQCCCSAPEAQRSRPGDQSELDHCAPRLRADQAHLCAVTQKKAGTTVGYLLSGGWTV